MTQSYTFTFKVDPKVFRRALYFNTFCKQRMQIFLVAAMWILGIGMLFANLVLKVEMTNVMQLCYVVLLITLPLLVFSCEHGYRQYRDSEMAGKTRIVSISPDWIKFRVGGSPESEKVEWRQMACVYELDDIFILYRDTNLMVVIPKSGMTPSQESEVRKIMVLKLGRAFRVRGAKLRAAGIKC